MGVNSVHIDDRGNVLRNYNDGDNTVFLHTQEKTGEDVDKKYFNQKGNSAGGEKIGELGGKIDANRIIENLLKDNGAAANNMELESWANKVKKDGLWDYKNSNKSDNNTIFGVAWAYDQGQRQQGNNDVNTTFNYQNNSMNAADFGNYNAGYTGTHADIGPYLQNLGAGIVEILKNKTYGQLFNPMTYLVAPYGDKARDYKLNNQGMQMQKKR